MADPTFFPAPGTRFVASYSGGKDCLLAVHRAQQQGLILQALLITYNTDRNRSWFHGIPRSVLAQVEKSVGAPVVLIETTGEAYAARFEAALCAQKALGAEACVFGDIDLAAHRTWGEDRCRAAGLCAVYPLWQESRAALAAQELAAGFAPVITVVDTTRLPARFLGRRLTPALLREIEATGADVCGENGEYHTFVTQGPVFRQPVAPHFGTALQEGQYVVLPLLESAAPSTHDLKQRLQAIPPADESAREAAVRRLDALAKPPGSLGALETIAARLAGITGRLHSDLSRRCVLVFAADNGVVDEGVASGPQCLTAQQTINMLRGLTGVAVLAKQYGADLRVTDVGVNAAVHHPALQNRKIRFGTDNIAKGPAMTRDEALRALDIGWQAAADAAREGYALLGVGEMGIGNTTTTSAVLCGLLGLAGDQAARTVGRGAGLTDVAYTKKLNVVQAALAVNRPDADDVVDVLAKVGGFDIAAMAGAFLGAAACRVPVVIDGFISVVAALCAARLCPAAKDAFFASHSSHERGYALALDALGLPSYLQLDMRLGEGSGCPLMFSIMDGACAVLRNMATFAEAEIDTAYLEELSKDTSF